MKTYIIAALVATSQAISLSKSQPPDPAKYIPPTTDNNCPHPACSLFQQPPDPARHIPQTTDANCPHPACSLSQQPPDPARHIPQTTDANCPHPACSLAELKDAPVCPPPAHQSADKAGGIPPGCNPAPMS